MNARWDNIDDSYLRKLDLRSLNDGRDPYPDYDNSIGRAYVQGKSFMDELIRDRIAFTNGVVLDLMSGFGRWIPPLASCNDRVVALERYPSAVNLSTNLCRHFDIENAEVICGDVSIIETFDSHSFDYVFIWGGLMLVDRRHVMTQCRRLLKPGGRIFSGAHTSTGLILNHILTGAAQCALFEGRFKHWLAALDRGPLGHEKLNFIDLENVESVCKMFGFSLIGSAPSDFLDVRLEGRRRSGWEREACFGPYFRTIEFVAKALPSEEIVAAMRADHIPAQADRSFSRLVKSKLRWLLKGDTQFH